MLQAISLFDFQASSVPSLSRVQLCVSWPQMHVLFLKKKKKCVGGRGGVKTWIETLKTSTKRPRGDGEQNQVNVHPKVSILGGLHFRKTGRHISLFPISSTASPGHHLLNKHATECWRKEAGSAGETQDWRSSSVGARDALLVVWLRLAK